MKVELDEKERIMIIEAVKMMMKMDLVDSFSRAIKILNKMMTRED